MQAQNIHGFTYELRPRVLDQLSVGITECGGWVLDRRYVTPSAIEFRLEIQTFSAAELYAAVASAGIELTRSAHDRMTSLCMHRQHPSIASVLDPVCEVSLRVEFLDDVNLLPIPSTGCAPS